ncbi:MAG: serine--tRNA ligase [Nanoarchaeota archaeon]|nr:serine--tRNA ligase [Nanoarchaeota archaeon]
MLDINLVRERPDLVKASEQKRNRDPAVVDTVLSLDQQWKKALQRVEELKHQRNVVSQEINQLKKAGQSGDAKIKEMRSVVEEIKNQEENVNRLLQQRNETLLLLGNILHPTVPEGRDAADNVELTTWGKKPRCTFPIKNHVEICESLGLADFDRAVKISGNGWYFHLGELGLLNQALIQFAIKVMYRKGYTYVEPPLLIKKEMLNAAINTEEFAKSIYAVEGEDLALIGTSEHVLLGIHAQEAISEKELPKKYFSYSMCFRKEIGAHGINEKGLWRRHQFNKVEQFIFCKADQSGAYFKELLQNSEEILQALELPYRIIDICAGDLSLWKHQSYDLEVWRPTTQSYGEVMSLSNCTDYQARKLGIKYVHHDGSRYVVHTLNNTALATSRILVAILENFQTKEGNVTIPKVLWPYMNGVKQLGKKRKK